MLEGVVSTWEQGGFVMPWLVGATIVLWYAVGMRALALRGAAAGARAAVAGLRAAGPIRERLAPFYDRIAAHRVLIRTLAATAPLVGLLGTVSGMIETFDALTTMALFRGSGGIAGGISEALVSTQMGLAVAIPGMLAGRTLERWQQRIEAQLDALGGLA